MLTWLNKKKREHQKEAYKRIIDGLIEDARKNGKHSVHLVLYDEEIASAKKYVEKVYRACLEPSYRLDDTIVYKIYGYEV